MIKPRKKYFKSIVVLASAAALVVVGSVMAYFSSTDQTTNKFTGSRFDIFLMETRWDAEKAKGVLPGDELEKNPQVINKEHTDGYIYLRVTVPCDVQMVDNDNGTPKANALENVPMYKFVTTAGTSIQETLPIIQAQGNVSPVGLVVSVDRMERGQGEKSALAEIEENYGLKTTAIVTMAEVIEHLYQKEYKGKVIINDQLKAAIDAYYDQYGVR